MDLLCHWCQMPCFAVWQEHLTLQCNVRRWRSFHRGGSMALYMALYSVGFLVNTLHSLSGLVSVVLYLSYMGLVLWAIYLAMGTVGFFASFLFTYKIFGAVKAD